MVKLYAFKCVISIPPSVSPFFHAYILWTKCTVYYRIYRYLHPKTAGVAKKVPRNSPCRTCIWVPEWTWSTRALRLQWPSLVWCAWTTPRWTKSPVSRPLKWWCRMGSKRWCYYDVTQSFIYLTSFYIALSWLLMWNLAVRDWFPVLQHHSLRGWKLPGIRLRHRSAGCLCLKLSVE